MVCISIGWIPIIQEMQGGQLYIYIQVTVAYRPHKRTDLSHSSPRFTVWGSATFSCTLVISYKGVVNII